MLVGLAVEEPQTESTANSPDQFLAHGASLMLPHNPLECPVGKIKKKNCNKILFI